MKKLFLTLLFINLWGYNLKYALHSSHAFPFLPHKTLLIFEYQKLNDTIDVLNIKSQELGDTVSKYASIGDMDGYKLSITYGLNNKTTLFFKINPQNIQYGNGTLKNKRYEIFGRYNFYQNDFLNTAYSFDIGGIINKADDIRYSNKNLMENLAVKILKEKKPNVKSVEINPTNIKIHYIGTKNKDIIGITQTPFIEVNDMKDMSYYIKALYEKKINNIFLTLFTKLNFTKIHTTVKANDELVQKAKEKFDLDKNLDRNEKSLNIGFNISGGIDYVFEFEYYYTKIFRESGLDYIDYNHVVKLDIIKPINKSWFIFAGGKVMYRQFNGEIPYLYNKYSQTTFDHKYGYARAGVGFLF